MDCDLSSNLWGTGYFDTTSPTAPDCNSNGSGLSGQNWPGDATTYDALGRPLTITHADGSTIQTSYNGRATEVADEGNGAYDVTRISQVNGLGELTNVCEVDSQSLIGPGGAPAACGLDIGGTGFLTSYSYNPLGDLAEVQQNGLDNRVYGYDSLGRLTSSDNPETGTLSYAYDNAACGAPAAPGSLTCRTDANSITTAYFYDALRRLTQKTYSDGTPALEIGYDQSGGGGQTLYNTLGRESTAVSGNTAEMFSYDADGRQQNHYECFSSTCGSNLFEIGYGHDLLGDMTALEAGGVAPQGAPLTFAYSYNQAARLTGMSSNYVDASHPATLLSGASYNARGQMLADTLGNGVSEQWAYDGNNPGFDAPGRGRLTQISAGANGAVYSESLSYEADGDVHSVNDSVNGAWTYQYDPMNRLVQASCGSASGCDGVPNGNGLAFVYDRFGNLWQQNYVQGGQAGAQVSFTGGNNRTDSGCYNPEGDLECDGAHSYAYNARGQLENADGGATASYAYFPFGARAVKITGGNTFWYLYDAQGRQLAELNSSGAWVRGEIFAGSRHIASYANSTTYFDHNDSLNTARVRTGVSGAVSQTCANWPFGNALNCSGTGGSPLHFTGQERDQETGLDYFGARYSSSNFGRFMTPDWSATPTATPYVALANPQSLNLYSYVLDNPITSADSNGHDCCIPGENLIMDAILWYAHKPPQTQARIKQAAKGTGQVIVGVAGLVVGGTVDVGSGGLATAATVVLAQGSATSIGMGTSNLISAATGKGGAAMRKADTIVSATRNIPGQVATAVGVATGRGTAAGEAVATVTDVATANPSALATGTVGQRLASAIVQTSTAASVAQEVRTATTHASPQDTINSCSYSNTDHCTPIH